VIEHCEWDPENNEPARFDDGVDTGCKNEATVSVGAAGQWHLCATCAALPRFNAFRARRPIKKRQE